MCSKTHRLRLVRLLHFPKIYDIIFLKKFLNKCPLCVKKIVFNYRDQKAGGRNERRQNYKAVL